MKQTIKPSQSVVPDMIVIKKMRLLRGLNRNAAALLLSSSRASIQRYETGVSHLTHDKIAKFAQGYGYTMNDFTLLKLGQHKNLTSKGEMKKVRIIEHNDLRRSYKKIIGNEVKALVLLRLRKGLSQYKASKVCGWSKCTIGHIEQGRIELPSKRIEHIVKSYGFSMNLYNELLESDFDRFQMEQKCVSLIRSLTNTKLKTVEMLLATL